MVHHFIFLRLNPFDLKVDRQGWWFKQAVSELWVCLSADSAKNVFWRWLSPLQGWGSLTMACTGQFLYVAHHFILLRLNPFDLRVDREGQWIEHSVPQLQVCLSAKGSNLELEPQQDEMVSHLYKFTSECHSQTTPERDMYIRI